MRHTPARMLAVVGALALLMTACGGDDDGTAGAEGTPATKSAENIDYEAIGLWDDGPCDESKPPLVVGLMTVFESPVISLKDAALALEAAADGFNERGGANGACIEVHTCDDGANIDQSLACVRELDEAGVVATINDLGTAGLSEVSEAMAAAGIPRVATNVNPSDWADPNAYPTDASATGFTLVATQALLDQDADKVSIIRVGLPEAAAAKGLLRSIYDDRGAEFVADLPVASGTTDYSQYILSSQDAGAEGALLALGAQEAQQIVRAGGQLATDLLFGTAGGTFSHEDMTKMGDVANNLVFVWPYPPITSELPVYDAVRADFAASGEELLQPAKAYVNPIRSWLGLYALLKMIRDAGLTDFSRESITQLLHDSKDVPMLGFFGDDTWTSNLDHPGLFTRAGTNHWGVYRWDADAEAPDGLEGNLVQVGTLNFDELMCASALGEPEPC
jgi:ABC-type branched-subunit amino acid transport system substrate-binding protein